MHNILENLKLSLSDKQHNECVVKLTTSWWHDKRGVHQKRSLIYVRRKCVGYNVLEEDVGCIGAEETFPRILNLDECEDGIYTVVTCNESRDWETGYIDDYDYRLIPYREINNDTQTNDDATLPILREGS